MGEGAERWSHRKWSPTKWKTWFLSFKASQALEIHSVAAPGSHSPVTEGKEAALGVGPSRRSMCQPCSGMQAYLMALAAFPSCQKCSVESAVQQEALAADRGRNTQEGRSCLVSRFLSISLCPSVSLSVLPSRWPPTARLRQMPLYWCFIARVYCPPIPLCHPPGE